MRSMLGSVALTCVVLLACPSGGPRPQAPLSTVDVAPAVATASTTPTAPMMTASAATRTGEAEARDAGGRGAVETLALGEAIALEAKEIRILSKGPRSMTWYGRAGLVVLAAEAPGEAVVELVLPDGSKQQRTFRIVDGFCRDTPLHPALLLAKNEKVVIEVGETTEVLATLRSPWVASAHAGPRKGTVSVVAAGPGHSTVVAWRADGVSLFDVYVEGACRERGYRALATSAPNAPIGPKGDGTCVYHAHGTPSAPCPDLAALGKQTNDDLAPIVCDWAAACERMGDEGCCVECKNPFRVRLKRTCAERMLRAKTCRDVQKVWDTPTCHA